jgi:hypothetical protein
LHQFCEKATRVDKGMMTKTSFCNKHSLLRAALVLLVSTAAYSAQAQVEIPALVSAPRIAVFSTFTDVKPNKSYVDDLAVWGFSAGGYLQTRHIVGAEVRGSITRWGSAQHEESILVGPRASMHFGGFAPYVAILGGGGNAWQWNKVPYPWDKPPAVITEETGPQATILGGVDFHVRHRLSFRMGELSYSKIYMKDHTITPISASAGIVYRVNWPSRGGR